MKLLVVNGPNLNMLGVREPSVYGNMSYNEIENAIREYCIKKSIQVEIFQSNNEGELIDKIHNAGSFDGIIINAGAYTHTSIAIRDALASIKLPFIEVHISNVYKRESFRHKSYLADLAIGVIAGFGLKSYLLAIDYFAENT
ncbi:MAG: 3-dehydroquinate dehydratase [Deferribacteres bacterium]|jgi:3-dehydroquinate dehydratase-2|nr:3-dehydroquinate dehydratase [Deferribacteres bacterium]